MLLTEEEAKDRWCPFTRVGEQASGAAENRPDGSYNCIASQCMAWRWEQIRQPVPGKDPLAEQQIKLVQGERGWCGLVERGRGPFG